MESHPNIIHAPTFVSGIDVFDGLGVSFGTGADSLIDNSDHGGGIYASLDLPLRGECGMLGVTMTLPLPRPMRAAIPGYLHTYWDKVDPLFPVVHRQSFEAAPEDVLRCAMAAVATQFLNGKDDRTRGNQLHEFAWQEAKRVSPDYAEGGIGAPASRTTS